MTQTIQLPETGRQIAYDYYRNTPHVFASDYPDKLSCAYCGWPKETVTAQDASNDLHITPTEKSAPTVVEVIILKPGNYVVKGSCGHEPRRESYFDGRRRPSKKVGDPFDCWTCDTQWHDVNYPGLPEHIQQQIQALVPRCPECGEQIKYLPLIAFQKHDVYFDLDGSFGELNGTSDLCDTLSTEPEWERNTACFVTSDGWQTGEIAVSCGNDHDWKTRQLAWKHEDSTHKWRVINTADS